MYGEEVEKETLSDILNKEMIFGIFIGIMFGVLIGNYVGSRDENTLRDNWAKNHIHKNAKWNGSKYIVSEFDLDIKSIVITGWDKNRGESK